VYVHLHVLEFIDCFPLHQKMITNTVQINSMLQFSMQRVVYNIYIYLYLQIYIFITSQKQTHSAMNFG